MEAVQHLVVGAGISGLSFANAIRAEGARRGRSAEVCVLEADQEPGGYCKTVVRDGFVWDYSGHFFHFKHPAIEAWLRERLEGEVVSVAKRSFIRYAGLDVDFPFQKNIHQLPREDFVECLHDLYFRERGGPPPASFHEMLHRKFGRAIAEKFLVPYNEKLYACDLGTLDVDAMGRFFPQADIDDVIRNMRAPDNASYNSTFTYPRRGAIAYVHALLRDLPPDAVSLGERVVSIDLRRRVATTTRRELRYERLVSSAPLDRLARASALEHDGAAFTYNRVLVFNLGFDRKGPEGVHWMYFPDRSLAFYRVGFYDNIFGDPRMSLYVEVGCPKEGPIDVEALRERVLSGLRREGIVKDHQLVASHEVVMDPAYVHVTRASLGEVARLAPIFAAGGVYPVGRYGGWTYCSIEDNILETRALARTLGELL